MSTLTLRRKLLLSTATVIGALSGYGRSAYALCANTGGSNYLCSGANGSQQTINANDATVTTDPGFSVNTGDPFGVSITGDGALSYIDDNASTVTATGAAGAALSITTTTYGAAASITVETTGALTGTAYGIFAYNHGAGATNITVEGDVTATGTTSVMTPSVAGIYAYADMRATDLTLTIGADATIRGVTGVNASNFHGSGTTTIDIYGDIIGGPSRYGLRVAAGSGDANITIAASSTITGGTGAILGGGNGSFDFVTNGEITGTDRDGIEFAALTSSVDTMNLTLNGTVRGAANGLVANLATNGDADIRVTGDVTGEADDGILVRQFYGYRGLTTFITVGAGGTVSSTGTDADDFGIQINYGGAAHITVAGEVNGGAGGAIRFAAGAGYEHRLEIHSTAVINGDVFAGPGANDTLAFAGDGDGTFNLNNIDDGGGTEQFQDFDIFEVDSGTWSFNGATDANFQVNGGTVKGTGTFGGLTVDSGILAPGNSIGTMTVNGAFALNAGATFEVEVNAAGAGDQMIVNGTVNITGATLRVLAANGDYALSTDYVIIDNDGADAVVGTFGTITNNLAFLTPTVVYNGGTGNDVVLTLARTMGGGGGGGGGGGDGFMSFCTVAVSDNQCDVAMALDQFPTGNELFLAVLTQTVEGARQAFDALSGEIHASAAGVLADDNRYVREAIMGRLMQAGHTDSNGQMSALGALGPQVASLDQDGLDQSAMALGYDNVAAPSSPMAFWTAAYGAWGKYDGNGDAATADRDLGGFMSGMDASIGGSWRVGLTTGASYSNISVDARNSSADAESYYLGGYTGGMVGAFALRGGGTWAWSEIDTSRAVVFPGFFERQKASYDADSSQIFGELAYPTSMGGMSVEPYANLAYVSIDTDSFVERGGALASLSGRGTDQGVGYSTLGLRAAATTQWGSTVVTPHISAAWQHAFDDVTPEAALAFASTGIGFNVTGVPLAEDSALIDAGLDFALGENTSAGVSYSGQFGDGVTDNAVKGRFTWLF